MRPPSGVNPASGPIKLNLSQEPRRPGTRTSTTPPRVSLRSTPPFTAGQQQQQQQQQHTPHPPGGMPGMTSDGFVAGSFLDMQQRVTGRPPILSPYEEYQQQVEDANRVLAAAGRPPMQPPPPVYMQMPPQVVYVDTATGQQVPPPGAMPGQPPPWAGYPPPGQQPYTIPNSRSWEWRNVGMTLAEATLFTLLTTGGTLLLHGSLRRLFPGQQTPQYANYPGQFPR